MDHNAIRHMLSEYIDGAVTAEEKSEIEAHLKTCEQCKGAVSELRKTIEHIKQVEEVEPPAWMTQKIMAQVREEAEKKRSIFQKLFYPLAVKLPLEAVGVLFLAVTAFYVYQTMQPTEKYYQAPVEIQSKQEPAPEITAKGSENKISDSSRQLMQAPQSPNYKALDMKPEYEKPAPPILADRIAPAPAPSGPIEQPILAKKEAAVEKRSASPQAGASNMAEKQGAAVVPQIKLKSSTRVQKKKAAAVEANGPAIILRAKDINSAAREIEQAINRLGGSISRKETTEARIIFTVSVNVQKIQELKTKLKLIGEIEGETGTLGFQDDMVELKIELDVKSNKP